ncbi:SRPBCC family protein [Sphingomonas morindae]|uniref:SRPBCC family protein n=1 Tax=Sphingomonas morindae TaxID=1541170 RepID=A0ABY4X970_9SPHN|nr:SRPBCC family protein [Sphingomonas morindae]USI73484.1 SRPBCC family protein [Sphingomonas morindae]
MTAATAEKGLDAAAHAAVTIGRPAEALRTLWLDPETQAQIWTHFATVVPLDGRTADWRTHGPAGGDYRWRTEIADSGPDTIRWSSLDGADVPNTGDLSFRPAPGDRGTELHLNVRFDPPGGLLGDAVSKLFHIVPTEIVAHALYKFRALALTGEIPTTEPQPAARKGGADR